VFRLRGTALEIESRKSNTLNRVAKMRVPT
jgi:hypothetical protein